MADTGSGFVFGPEHHSGEPFLDDASIHTLSAGQILPPVNQIADKPIIKVSDETGSVCSYQVVLGPPEEKLANEAMGDISRRKVYVLGKQISELTSKEIEASAVDPNESILITGLPNIRLILDGKEKQILDTNNFKLVLLAYQTPDLSTEVDGSYQPHSSTPLFYLIYKQMLDESKDLQTCLRLLGGHESGLVTRLAELSESSTKTTIEQQAEQAVICSLVFNAIRKISEEAEIQLDLRAMCR